MDSYRDYDYSNNEMDRSFEDYSDVWNESTAAFRQNHLIDDHQSRQRLMLECEIALGARNYCYRSTCAGSALYDAVYEACSNEARSRFNLIQDRGYFAFDGFSYLDRNTLIVSSYSDIIIRYSPNYYRSIDNLGIHFKIERTDVMQHLYRNSRGHIDHFQR